MNLQFDVERLHGLDRMSAVEFGVGREDGDIEALSLLPVEAEIQGTLVNMALTTWERMEAEEFGRGQAYDPSDKQESSEYLTISRDDDMAQPFLQIHEVALDLDPGALQDPPAISLYFARFRAGDGRRLTGIRKATQFKGVLKSRGRLIRLIDDSLRLVEDNVFKLDEDFDVLVDDRSVHILHPKSFEALGGLQQAILNAVGTNAGHVAAQLPFVQFDSIDAYARTHPRAARYLASIRAQGSADGVDRQRLVRWCRLTGVEVRSTRNGVEVPPESVLGFLEVLDRRRYELELVPGAAERYRATGRSRVED